MKMEVEEVKPIERHKNGELTGWDSERAGRQCLAVCSATVSSCNILRAEVGGICRDSQAADSLSRLVHLLFCDEAALPEHGLSEKVRSYLSN
jgi:hypothetical protein